MPKRGHRNLIVLADECGPRSDADRAWGDGTAAISPGAVGRDGSGCSGPDRLHVCVRCASLKPAIKCLSESELPDAALPCNGGIWALELCCGTGGALAFMHSLGFSVVGVDLVAAACQLAAEKLTAVAGRAVVVQSVEAVANLLRFSAKAASAVSSAASPALGEVLGGQPLPEIGISFPSAIRPRSAASTAATAAAAPTAVEAAPVPAAPLIPAAGCQMFAESRAQTGTGQKGRHPPPQSGLQPVYGPMGHSCTEAKAPLGTGQPQAVALLAQGDLFLAAWPRGFFGFVYDCQGLHAMPPELRPGYVTVLRGALRSGGVALLLVGRAEEDQQDENDEEVDMQKASAGGQAVVSEAKHRERPAEAVAASELRREVASEESAEESCDKVESANGREGARNRSCAPGGCEVDGDDPGVGGPSSSRGPSLMTRRELHALFGAADWEWCWCERTRFDCTPVYARLPRPPPAWSLLVKRRREDVK